MDLIYTRCHSGRNCVAGSGGWMDMTSRSNARGGSGSSGKREVRIIGSGSYLPGEPLPNDVVLQMCNLGVRTLGFAIGLDTTD